MTTVEETRINGLLNALRDAETEWRRGYARVLQVVVTLDQEKPVTGFSTTAQMLAAVLNLSKGEASARAEQAKLLSPRRSLIGEALPATLPATAAELAAGVVSPAQLRVITATMRRIPPGAHPEAVAQAEETLLTPVRRFDPAALTRIGDRLLAHLDPDGDPPRDDPETTRELRVRTGADGAVNLTGHPLHDPLRQ